MSDLLRLFDEDAANNFIDLSDRIRYLETLQTAASGGSRGPVISTSDKYIEKTSSYTILASDLNIGYELFLSCKNTTAANFTLPDAAAVYDSGATSTINISRLNAPITILFNGTQTGNGHTSITMAKNDTLSFISNNTGWRIK